MSALINNVVGFDNKSVYSSIVAFLEYRGDKSKNTKLAYENDIKYFFSYMKGKDLTQLTKEDLYFEHEQIIKYRNHLKKLTKNNGERKYKNTTINRKISSLRSLYEFLLKNNYEVNKFAFDLDDLPENDSEKIGILSKEEAEQMVELAKSLPNGLEKSLLIELAYKTSIRLSALLALTWRDIKKIDSDKWLVTVFDKGNKKDKKPITDEFYQRLLVLKKDGIKNVFNISHTTVHDTIVTLCKQMGIEEDRNISFHSLKNVAVNWVLKETGDIVAASKQANHSSITTTYQHYIDQNIDYDNYAGIMMEKSVDISELENLDKEMLLNIIRKCSQRTQNEIINMARKERG